jgi:hypothetical protein
MCATKFDLEEEQLAFIRDYLAEDEIEVRQEERVVQRVEDEIEPISDTKEDANLTHFSLTQPSLEPLLETTNQRSKRQQSVSSDDDLNLPDLSNMLGSQRVSGRIRKRSRLLEGYEI